MVTRVLDLGQSDLPVREMQNATLICNNFLMCGRYRLSRRKQVVEEYFDTAPVEHDWNPRYNIAPTQNVPIIRQNPKEPVREMSFVRWGLIPSGTLLAKYHMTCRPSCAKAEVRVGAGRTPLQ
ncbi:MAG: SOS response-associated peptidase [Acidobacteriia bacterium]|nr:SOS response-associated peptidase [Terriglobia bacterium]